MKIVVKNNIGKALAAANGGGLKGLHKAAQDVKSAADGYVPVGATGLLESSGVVKEYDDRTVDVRYGTNGAYWGMILHAHPEYAFQSGRRAQFLEAAVKDTRKVAAAIADGLKAEFNAKGG